MKATHQAAGVATALALANWTPVCSFVFGPVLDVAGFVGAARPADSRSCFRQPLSNRTPWGQSTVKRAGRHRGPVLMSATAERPHGSVTFLPENEELAAEETVEIVYSPPRELFRDSDTLLYCGGFNGWDGEDEAITLPMIPIEDGKFRVSINIPNFARVLDFVVTDGVRYDTGPGEAFYHALVTHVIDADKTGNIITYRQESDGTLVKTGVIEKTDPLELERMMEKASKAQTDVAVGPTSAPMVDDTIADVEKSLRQEIMVSVVEQDAVQKMRAEASVLGERLGLGNMQVNEARDAFDVFDSEEGLLAFEDVGKVLDKLGFDELDSSQQAELIGTHVLEKRPDATSVTLMEFMYMFKALDEMDVGIDIC